MTAAIALSIHICSPQKLLSSAWAAMLSCRSSETFFFPLVISTQQLPRQMRQNLPELTIILESVHQLGSVLRPKDNLIAPYQMKNWWRQLSYTMSFVKLFPCKWEYSPPVNCHGQLIAGRLLGLCLRQEPWKSQNSILKTECSLSISAAEPDPVVYIQPGASHWAQCDIPWGQREWFVTVSISPNSY